MGDVYTAVGEIKKLGRVSVDRLKKIILPEGHDSLLSSFVTFPKAICFETQELGEEVVLFLRQHLIINTPWVLLVLLALTIPSVFEFFPLYPSLPVIYQFVINMMWYLFVFGFSLSKFLGWFFNIMLVTDERVVDVDFVNLFYRVISTAKTDDIQDVNSTVSGAAATFFNYGSVFIQTAAEVSQFQFENVPHPDRVAKMLNILIDQEEQEKIEGRVK